MWYDNYNNPPTDISIFPLFCYNRFHSESLHEIVEWQYLVEIREYYFYGDCLWKAVKLFYDFTRSKSRETAQNNYSSPAPYRTKLREQLNVHIC